MDDNDKLLKAAINLHYHNRPYVVAEAMHVIEEYLKKEQTDSEYDKVLKTLHDLMNDLPSNILIYFLTTVPLPKQKGEGNSSFSELMKKSRVPLIENMQTVLTDYLNNAVPPPPIVAKEKTKSENEVTISENKVELNCQNKRRYSVDKTKLCSPKRQRSNTYNIDTIKSESQKKIYKQSSEVTADIITYSCKKLLDICAEYIVFNFDELQQFYDNKNETAWKIVNKNVCTGEEQTQCYKLITDINKKRKWLRMIEAGHISVDVIREEYGDSEIFLKAKHVHNIIDEDAFTVSNELREAIENYIRN